MNDKIKNPVAFSRPVVSSDKHGILDPGETGMPLRDYFAAHADIPWNATIETWKINNKSDEEPTVDQILQYRAEIKYIEADAMLAERATKDEEGKDHKVTEPKPKPEQETEVKP